MKISVMQENALMTEVFSVQRCTESTNKNTAPVRLKYFGFTAKRCAEIRFGTTRAELKAQLLQALSR